MMSPTKAFQTAYGRLRRGWKLAFFTCFFVGLLVHMPILLSDIPNHDGLDSMYFDQNMITSGRWFLTIACGFSSYYTIPWVIGILGLVFLAAAAAALCELLEVGKTWAVMLCSALLAVFPALASTFAYVYTLDGYMMALFLAVLSVLFTRKYRLGFLPGALCLAFSMGIYQSYLSFAMILSVFAIWMLFDREGEGAPSVKEKLLGMLRYLYMGVLGTVLYFGILQLLLLVQGKGLDTYQGIDGMVAGGAGGLSLPGTAANMYRDFFSFTLKGNVLFQNPFSTAGLCILAAGAAAAVFFRLRRKKYWKNPALLIIMILTAAMLPLATNVILLISPDVNYHLLMRYQWVLYLTGAVALLEKGDDGKKVWLEWAGFLAAAVMVFCYCVTDNIAYSNLQKRYEKTYAYCVRLLDRIEQTEGYYPGIPIAMVGVVGDEQYPVTDITLPVTSGMIGMNGDVLLYMGKNYGIFMKNYLGATLNILPAEAMESMYYAEEYMAMDSFPGKDSIRIIDGVMYIKTENAAR